MTFSVTFIDTSPTLCREWREQLVDIVSKLPEGYRIEVVNESINNIEIEDYYAIITPGNSYGIMDGGFDQVLRDLYASKGVDLQNKVTEAIKKHGAYLPVGNALILDKEVKDLPYVVYVPTMAIPTYVGPTINAFLATTASLEAIAKALSINKTPEYASYKILITGMCSNNGGMAEDIVAKQMFLGYQQAFISPVVDNSSWDSVRKFYNYIWNQ